MGQFLGSIPGPQKELHNLLRGYPPRMRYKQQNGWRVPE